MFSFLLQILTVSLEIPNEPVRLNLLGSKDVDTSLFLIPNRKIYLNYNDKIKRNDLKKNRQASNEYNKPRIQRNYLSHEYPSTGKDQTAQQPNTKQIFSSRKQLNQKSTKPIFKRNVISHTYPHSDISPPNWFPGNFKKLTIARNYTEPSMPSKSQNSNKKLRAMSIQSDDSNLEETPKQIVFLNTSEILKHHKVKHFDSQTKPKLHQRLLKTENSDINSYESERKKLIQLTTEELDIIDNEQKDTKPDSTQEKEFIDEL